MSEYNPDGILLTHEQWNRITALLTPMQKNKIFKQGIIGDFIPMLDESEDIKLKLKYWGHFILWTPDNYLVGANRLYSGYPYRCVQSHDSTPNPSWTPSSNPALWAPYHATTPEQALPWYSPTGQQDMYLANEWMIFSDGEYYKCLVNTTFTPTELPSAWLKDGEVTEPEEPVGVEYAPWAQPPNETPFMMNAKVSHIGKNWHSTIDNNVWAPGVYGWTEDI